MITSLIEAPPSQPLIVVAVHDSGLARELGKLGIRHGQELIRLEADVSVVQPVRLRGPSGEVLLSGNMASGLMVHLDNGDVLPLLEMKPGDRGHLEGTTVLPDSAMAETFDTLGLKENDSVELVRKLPPMEYVALVDRKKRVSLPGGIAAKVWGQSQGQKLQFATASAGKEFKMEKILGGRGAQKRISAMGLVPGVTLILEEVKPAQTVRIATKNPIAVSTPEGLRFWLPPQAAGLLMVQPKRQDS